MIKFYQLVQGGFPPRKASRSANGSLPTDGFRYCEPVRTASGFGWYVYLPMDFWLLWDGAEIQWTVDGGANWRPLADAIQYPGFSDSFDRAAPEGCRGYAPPFITRGTEHDGLQIWTGTMISTEPGFAALFRRPANLDWRTDYTGWEGVVETDSWFGPLFLNIRLRKMGTPIVFRRTEPFIQVQPIPRALLKDAADAPLEVAEGVEGLSAAEWEAYANTVVRRMQTRRRLGDYAVETRKRASPAPA